MAILLLTSFLAGILTILTPCTLPLLPIVLGGSFQNKSKRRPLVIIAALSISVFIFTLILKTGVNALQIDDTFIRIIAGLIILILGLSNLFPVKWTLLTQKIGLTNSSNKFLQSSQKYNGVVSAVLTGIALGPVFSSCSPTYGYILFAILPLNLLQGILCIIVFIFGMALFLFLISILGQKLINKTKWAVDPNGKFKKILGLIFVIIGIVVIFKIDKQIESYLLQQSSVQNILLNKVEQNIINNF